MTPSPSPSSAVRAAVDGEGLLTAERLSTPYRLIDVLGRHCTHSSAEERFWRYATPGNPEECWEWQGARNKLGYGRLNVFGAPQLAHRVSYALANGSAPAGLVVMHSCDNPPCVNPAHLSIGSQGENSADRDRKGRGNRGTRNGNAKLDEAKVADIRARLAAGEPQRSIASDYGVSTNLISGISTGRVWAHTFTEHVSRRPPRPRRAALALAAVDVTETAE